MRGNRANLWCAIMLACGRGIGEHQPGTLSARAGAGSAADGGTVTGEGSTAEDGAPAGIGDAGTPLASDPLAWNCDGSEQLLPSPRMYVTAYTTMNSGYCGLPTGNGEGHIALEVSESDHPSWDLLSPDGSRLDRADAWRGALFAAMQGYLIEQGNSGGANNAPEIQGVDSSGRRRDYTKVYGTPTLIPAPTGALLAVGPVSQSFVSPQTYEPAIWMLREDGAGLWGPTPVALQSTILGGASDMDGNVLVIQDGAAAFGGGSIAAQWFDDDGNALTGPFQLIAGFVSDAWTWFEGSPLVGGGLAVRRMHRAPASDLTTSEWLVIAHVGSSRPEPAPAWLRSRPNTNLTLIRGNYYAVLPWGRKVANCAQSVEILSSSGTSCRKLTASIDSDPCQTRDLRLGLEGTLLQMVPVDREQTPTPQRQDVHTCTLRFWPALVP
jgi:hypothetical protein